MDKKRKIIYILIVLMILSVSGYYLYQHSLEVGLTKPVLLVKVDANVTGSYHFNNVTFEQSSVIFFYKVGPTIPKFPEIDVHARVNELESVQSSYFASVPFEFDKDNQIITLTVYFKEGKEPKPGDVLILPIRMVGYTGKILYKTTAFYEWQ